MKMCSIASGSSGNCIYVGTDTTHLLVDAGISCKRILEGLTKIGVDSNTISGILVTHEHIDHINGLGVISRKLHIPIYATRGTIQGILDCPTKTINNIDQSLFRIIDIDEDFYIGDILIHPFSISHDANEPCAYTFAHKNKKIGIATDLGFFDDYIISNLQNLNAILIEANHDVNMLLVGPYQYHLKQRVLGEKGHLSNESCGVLLTHILNDKLQYILLGHLSGQNNLPSLAYETIKLEIDASATPYKSSDFLIEVASRNCESNIVYIA